MLPPDNDSNQTLTASCRADVWAGATLKPEEQQKDGGENNGKAIRHMGKELSRTQQNKAEPNNIKGTDGGGYMVHWEQVGENYTATLAET